MLVVLDETDGYLSAHDATLWERLLTQLRADRLDRELARGASPEAGALLALRAQLLVQPAVRRELARRVASIVAEAAGTAPRVDGLRVPVRRGSVRVAAQEMWALVNRLLRPSPLPACGMAQVQLLLTDGSGPLYYEGCGEQLRATVIRAVDALEPLHA